MVNLEKLWEAKILKCFGRGMTGGKMTGNRQSLRYYKNDRDYDRGFVWVSTENLSWKEHYYHYSNSQHIV